jgi:hypothetical protein
MTLLRFFVAATPPWDTTNVPSSRFAARDINLVVGFRQKIIGQD